MKVGIENTGYLSDKIVAVGTECDALDMSQTVPNLVSSGYCEPIYQSGHTAKYRIEDIDVPEWLMAGILVGKKDGRWYSWSADMTAAMIITGRESGFGLHRLIARNGKFADSLKIFFSEKGYLSEKQVSWI